MASLARVDDIEAPRLASGLDDAFALVAGRFFRREVRVRARACLAGMLSGLERYRYVTFAMFALAWLAVTRVGLADDSDPC